MEVVEEAAATTTSNGTLAPPPVTTTITTTTTTIKVEDGGNTATKMKAEEEGDGGSSGSSSSGSATATAMVDDSRIMKGGDGEKAADFANYFCSYAYLYHQKQMLTDLRRMSAYHDAIMKNAEVFQGKTVLDVGTGT